MINHRFDYQSLNRLAKDNPQLYAAYDDKKLFSVTTILDHTKPEHLVYLDGMIIDYQKRGLNEGFEFIDGREKDRCGCGESFRV